MDSLQTTLNNIRNDEEKRDEHEDVALYLIKIRCVIGFNNNDFSTMINGKPNNVIEKKPFDRAFIKERIKMHSTRLVTFLLLVAVFLT